MPIEFGNLRLYSFEEVAAKFRNDETGKGVTVVTLRAYVKQGLLKGRKIGGMWYTTEELLRQFVESGLQDQEEQPA